MCVFTKANNGKCFSSSGKQKLNEMNFQADEGVENTNCAEERRRRQLAKREWEKGGERKRHVAHAQDLDLGWDRKLLHPAAVRNTVTT